MRFEGLVRLLQPHADNLYAWAEWMGLNPRITSVRRSRAQQEVLYERYKAGLNPYPVLPPGMSMHELGLAFDMVCDNPRVVGAGWKRLGGTWGGKSDPVHFEWRPKGLRWNGHDWSFPTGEPWLKEVYQDVLAGLR